MKSMIHNIVEGNHDEIPIIRFPSFAIRLVSKLSLVIGSMRLDIVDPNRLAHAILVDWIKKWILQTVIMS